MTPKTLSLLILLVLMAGCIPASVTPQFTPITELQATPMLDQANQTTSVQRSTFALTSPDLPADERLPVEYTCDGEGSTLALNWSGAPEGTKSYAVIMHHVAAPGEVHWYWVLYNIPTDVTSLAKNVSGIGTLGNNINNGLTKYSPPCSKGPGDKEYIFTVYALSAEPELSVPAENVDRDALLSAIKDITLASAELHTVYARAGITYPNSQQGQQTTDGKLPPKEAFDACVSKAEKDPCSFTAAKGLETGTCSTMENQLACFPLRGQNINGQGNNPSGNGTQQGGNNQGGSQLDANGSAYNIEQAISDKAQGMTISYDALAFMTGDLGADSFFPPGKVADFWGFQYLRDNDPTQMGHAGDFLTSAAMNTLNNLTAEQRAELVKLAQSQTSQINEYGYKRFVLIQAFRRLLDGDLPAGTTGLNEDTVKAFSAELYKLDGEISFPRAELYGKIINSLTPDQKAYFDGMVGKGMKEWPTVEEPSDIRGLERDVKVAAMTYAADMFSWYAGSVDADVYFCPERHGTYFGSFYLKDIKAMSDPTYSIPTNLTGDLGQTMLDKLTPEQSQLITSLVTMEKNPLQGIVDTRRAISVELRKFLSGGAADEATVLSMMEQYGAYDGQIIYNMAANFSKVGQSLTDDEKAQLIALRTELLGDQSHPVGVYLYSQAVPMPEIPNTDFLFK
jgi:Raf kinase inhibitor-like YbhB/YbcL family protein